MTDLEKKLLNEIRNGDGKSFEIIFKCYYSRLCKYARSIINDHEASSDLVKDVFIDWWKNHQNVIINTTIAGYLYKSVHYNCINYINRVVKKRNTVYESDLSKSLHEILSPISPDNPLVNLGMEELYNALEKSIDALPDQCRAIFILSRIEQKTHAQIADKLGISQNTVKVQIYRALLKLREDLKDFLPTMILLFGPHFFQV